MDKKFNIAVVTATEDIADTARFFLEERQFSLAKFFFLSTKNDDADEMEILANFDFTKVDFALFFSDKETAKKYIPKAVKAGCRIIDSSGFSALDENVPLIIPEVNAQLIKDYAQSKIIANPTSVVVQLAMILQPILQKYGLKRVNVATYQAVSDAASAAVDELALQTADILNGHDIARDVFEKQIAFNLLPQVGAIQDEGYTDLELLNVVELRRILGVAELPITLQQAYVPVFYGNGCALWLETVEEIDLAAIINCFELAPGIIVVQKGYPTPLSVCADGDAVYIGRVRQDLSNSNALCLWSVMDNLRKGMVLNVVEIMELLKQYE